MIRPARVLLNFIHPDITVRTHCQGEEFLFDCAATHTVYAKIIIGCHHYHLHFSAYGKKPKFELELSRGRLDDSNLIKLADALNALAALGRVMSLAVNPSEE